MSIKKKIFSLLNVLVGIILVLSACSGSEETSSEGEDQSGKSIEKAGGEITFGLAAEPTTLNTYMQNGTHGRTIKLAISRGLYNYNENGELEAELAESYEANDELTSYTFELRDAKFHNGDKVTGEDVKYTFERIIDDESTATFNDDLSLIDDIEVIDETTVTFHLSEPSAPFLHYTALPESVIVSKDWTEEHPDEVETYQMGAGPFKFVEWNQGSHLVVEKFEDYYKEDKPYLDEVRFEFFDDENTRVNALRSEDAELIETVPWKDATSIEEAQHLKLDNKNGPFMQLQFNTEFEPFSDPKVRRALAYAIDRDNIIKTAFSGRGEPIYGMAILDGYLGYDEKFENYFEQDYEKAKELLTEAGYPDGFEATLLATSQYGMHEQTAVAVQSELKKVGIEVELDLPDWATRTNKNMEGDYDFLVAGTAGDITDADWMSNFYEGGEVRLNNSAYFDDEQINQLLEEGREESDEAKREEIYQELMTRAMELSPFVYLNWREQSYGMVENINGFTNLDGFLSFQSGVTLEETYIEE
ncbi:ABC transporter substrate-binding protein [Salibacterium aidingense]|uniref:ABC transporter substrate-binding protein n=1 Tax=Salibacterium aidingense TaxID=384933 RepID=UPI003BBDFD90